MPDMQPGGQQPDCPVSARLCIAPSGNWWLQESDGVAGETIAAAMVTDHVRSNASLKIAARSSV
jgi:hypothetical protein